MRWCAIFILLCFVAFSVTADTEKTVTLYPTDDTKIDEFFASNNYGGSKSLEVRNGEGLFGGGWEIDSLLKFDLSSIPKNATIISAELKLYYYKWKDNNPAGRELNVYRIESDWNEESVTWNNKPSYASTKTSSAIIPSEEGAWMSWDVKKDVEKILNDGTNYGWIIKDDNTWGSTDIPYAFFYSKENAENRPHLIITYEAYEKEKEEKKGIPAWEISLIFVAIVIAAYTKHRKT